jgi:hypothetical protein
MTASGHASDEKSFLPFLLDPFIWEGVAHLEIKMLEIDRRVHELGHDRRRRS